MSVSSKTRVAVAMSGGVDSSVAAAILKQEGYEVIGITMQIWPSDKQAEESDRFGGCCGIGAVEDARKVAGVIGIPHYVMNFREIFARKVIDNFCQEYAGGKTPNPCIRCNQYIKFEALMDKVAGLGAHFLATGHYARIEKNHRFILKKGVDARKDQSYWLYVMTQSRLEHTLMPVGSFTKEDVRAVARRFCLPTAEKPESQDICFIPDGDYSMFLRGSLPSASRPGPILDIQGKRLGEHRGILAYTVGQRHGLGIGAKEPLYVVAIEPEKNAVIVGQKSDLYRDELIASQLNWISGDLPQAPFRAKAKIRYQHPEAEATVTAVSDIVHVKFDKPQMAITPGQAIVFYKGDEVLGGGVIEREKL